MRIQHNIPAMNAYRNFRNNSSLLSKNLEKLSSGYRINRAGDDAAGLAISEKMRAQISGLTGAQSNAKDGISLVQTAEGALTEVHDMLNRMVTLAEQSSNGTYGNELDREQLQKEVDQLRTEINRIADSANFNGIKLLDGSMDVNNAKEATSVTTYSNTFDFSTTLGASDIAKTYADDLYDQFEAYAKLGTGTAAGSKAITIGGKAIIASTDNGLGYGSASAATYAANKIKQYSAAILANQKVLGENTILHRAAPNATTSSFYVDLNNFSYTASTAGELRITIGSGASATEIVASITASAASASGALTASDLVGKVIDALSTTTASGTTLVQATIGGETYNVSADGNRLKFESVNNIELTTSLPVTIAAGGAPNVNWSESVGSAVGSNSNVKVAFTWASSVSSDEEKIKALGKTYDIGNDIDVATGASFSFTVNTVRALTTIVSASATSIATGTAAGAIELVTTSLSGRTLSLGTDGKITVGAVGNATAAAAISSSAEITFKYHVTASRSVEFTVKVSELGGTGVSSVATGATAPVATLASGLGVLTRLRGTYYVKNASASLASGDSLSITLPNVPVSGYEYRHASSASAAAAASAVATGAEAGDYYLFDGSGTSANLIGKFTVTVQALDSSATGVATAVYASSAASAASAISAANASEALTIEQKYTQTANIGGTGDYNTSTEVIKTGATDNSTRLASTMLKADLNVTSATATNAADNIFAGKIFDGAAMKLGEQTYVFAVGTDSTIADTNDAITVNLRDIENATSGLTGDDLGTALERLTLAAKDNTMFGVGYDKVNNEFTLTENVDYYTGSNVLLNTAEKIANQISFGTVKQTAEVSTTAAFEAKNLILQIGDTSDSYNQLELSIKDIHTDAMGIGSIDISTQTGAQDAIDKIKSAINYVSDVRGGLGATQNRLEHTINNLSVMVENITDAESTIRDTDIASEMMAYTKNSILNQAAQAMLAQANQLPQGVLQLLG